MIGSLQTCSCGDADVCVHVLFVMLKVRGLRSSTVESHAQSPRNSRSRAGPSRARHGTNCLAKVTDRLGGLLLMCCQFYNAAIVY